MDKIAEFFVVLWDSLFCRAEDNNDHRQFVEIEATKDFQSEFIVVYANINIFFMRLLEQAQNSRQ